VASALQASWHALRYAASEAKFLRFNLLPPVPWYFTAVLVCGMYEQATGASVLVVEVLVVVAVVVVVVVVVLVVLVLVVLAAS